MAAEKPAPWSRWDPPGATYNPPPPIFQPYGDTGPNGNNFPTAQPLNGVTRYIQGYLINQRDDPNNGDYRLCTYGDQNNPNPNNPNNDVLSCLRTLGCCETGCCGDGDPTWWVERGWAIALIVIFGIIVIIAVIVFLACWLFNRNRDKQQKKELLASSGSPSAAQSQVSGPYPAGVNNGYYPYVGGPNKYNPRF